MKKIQILCVGDLKEGYLKEAQAEYLKRLSSACAIDVTIVPEQSYSEKLSEKELQIKKDKEAELLLPKIKGYAIALCIDAKQFDSVEFANNLNQKFQDNATVTFIIGGSDGLSEKVINKCNQKISFSRLTFPHQLMRIVLLEQIYRTTTIWSGKTYHK